MKKKLLITGTSGFLGYHLLRLAHKEWELYGLYHRNIPSLSTATLLTCNITNCIELGNYIEDIEPDAVIHTAAIADTNLCETEKNLSYEVNVGATRNLAGICSDYQIPFVFTSTDLVFDGAKGMYKENDEKNPLSTYGEHKSFAEEEIMKLYPLATIFRLPLMFGYPDASPSNYIQKFIRQLQSKQPTKLFHDEYRSVCGAKSIAEGILKLMGNHTGIVHLAGREKISRYEFGKKVVQTFGLDASLVEACSQKDVVMSVTRPADVSLDISKAQKAGYVPLSVDEELTLIASGNYI